MNPRLRPRFFIACDLPAPDSAFVGWLATELVHALSGRFGFRGGLVLFGLGTAEAHAIVGRLPLGFDSRHLLAVRSDEHTSELQSLMRHSSAVFCLIKNTHPISLCPPLTSIIYLFY